MRTKVCASVLFTSAAVLAQGVESPRIPSPPYVTADIKTAAEIPQKPHPSPAARVLGGAVQPTGAAPAAAPFAPAAKAAAGGLASSVLGGALRGPIYDGAEDGDVWVWQPTFKARVGNRATTFYPFLGADVPSAWVEFRSPSVQIAGHSIPGRDAVAVRTEDRIALDRGSYVERFDVSDAGIEQSFVFSELPRRGDLTIQIPFGGPLRAQLDDGVVVFSGAHGGARYGRAVAFDARGERVAVTTALHGSTLRLTVAEAFVARARLPLVVDPMISPVSTITSATTIRSTDVSYDVDTDTHIVLVQVGISTTDQDVFAYLYQGDFSSGFAITTIDASTDCWEEPRVANNRLSKTFLVVAQVSANCSSPYWIAGRLMDLPSLNTGPPFDIAKATAPGHFGGDKIRPDVGGDPSLNPPTFFGVVWERVAAANDHDIHFKQVTSAGALRSPNPTLIDNGLGFESNPSISNSNGLPPAGLQRWGIAYQRTYVGPTTSEEDIYGTFVTWDGVPLQFGTDSIFPIDTSGNDDRDPSISSPTDDATSNRRSLVAVERRGTDSDIHGIVLDASNLVVANANLGQLQGLSPQVLAWPQRHPSVDSDGCRFAVSYEQAYFGTADFDIYAATFAYDQVGAQLVAQDPEQPVATYSSVESGNALASLRSSGGPRLTYAIAWVDDQLAAQDTVQAGLYGGYSGGVLYQARPTGCGNLQLGVQGTPGIGGQLTFSLSGSTGFLGFVLGVPVSQSVPLCAGCTIGVNGDSISGATFTADVPCSLNFVGLQFALQGFAFGPNGSGPCLNQLQLSDTLDIFVR